jgi:hypothetical protein
MEFFRMVHIITRASALIFVSTFMFAKGVQSNQSMRQIHQNNQQQCMSHYQNQSKYQDSWTKQEFKKRNQNKQEFQNKYPFQ